MPRPQVTWFAELMEERLKENDHKGGWDRESLWVLYRRLLEEAGEVAEVMSGHGNSNLLKELADVANFAMMIAGNIRERGGVA